MNCRTRWIIFSHIQTKLREAATALRFAEQVRSVLLARRGLLTFHIEFSSLAERNALARQTCTCGVREGGETGGDGFQPVHNVFMATPPPPGGRCSLVCTKVQPYIHTPVMFPVRLSKSGSNIDSLSAKGDSERSIAD